MKISPPLSRQRSSQVSTKLETVSSKDTETLVCSDTTSEKPLEKPPKLKPPWRAQKRRLAGAVEFAVVVEFAVAVAFAMAVELSAAPRVVLDAMEGSTMVELAVPVTSPVSVELSIPVVSGAGKPVAEITGVVVVPDAEGTMHAGGASVRLE